jgi:hypothetical protein
MDDNYLRDLTFYAGQGISGMVLGRLHHIRASRVLLGEEVNVCWDLLELDPPRCPRPKHEWILPLLIASGSLCSGI